MATDRLFPLSSYGDEYLTGHCADGRQVVMGLLCPHLVVYLFDANGRLLSGERQLWNHPAPRLNSGPFDIYNEAFRTSLDVQFRELQQSLGYSQSPIRVREFFDPDNWVGIEALPSHYRDLETIANEEERKEFIISRDRWLADGCFVWWWAKDYYMSKDGEVESS